MEVIRAHSSDVSRMISLKTKTEQFTALHLENKEFKHHPVLQEDFSKSSYLKKIFFKACEIKPKNYEELLAIEGVGPKTMRALSLVSEVIYGAKPSYEDPARYSFAHGGKDATPYPIDRPTYDSSIEFFSRLVAKSQLSFIEKRKLLSRLETK